MKTILRVSVEKHSIRIVPEGYLAEDLRGRPLALKFLILLFAHRVLTVRSAPVMVEMIRFYAGKGDVIEFVKQRHAEERVRMVSLSARDTRKDFKRFASWLGSRFRSESGTGPALVYAEAGLLEARDSLYDYIEVHSVLEGEVLPATRQALRRVLSSLHIHPDDATVHVPVGTHGRRREGIHQRLKTISRPEFKRLQRRIASGVSELDRAKFLLDQQAHKEWKDELRDSLKEDDPVEPMPPELNPHSEKGS